jgi:hypothetical protein
MDEGVPPMEAVTLSAAVAILLVVGIVGREMLKLARGDHG